MSNVTAPEIIELSAAVYGLETADLCGHLGTAQRGQAPSLARKVAVTLIRRHTMATWDGMARLFGVETTNCLRMDERAAATLLDRDDDFQTRAARVEVAIDQIHEDRLPAQDSPIGVRAQERLHHPTRKAA